jgi:hypothetical protein
MKNFKELQAQVQQMESDLHVLKNELAGMSDGFKYSVVVLSYGSRTVMDFNNMQGVVDLVVDYNSGEDGLLQINTTNPDMQPVVEEDYGCVDQHNVLTEEEFSKLKLGRDISKSEGLARMAAGFAGIDVDED